MEDISTHITGVNYTPPNDRESLEMCYGIRHKRTNDLPIHLVDMPPEELIKVAVNDIMKNGGALE